MKHRRNQGFTLVEMIVIVSIFAILLGILVPSLNSVLGFHAQRATQSIAASIDRTKIEAMSRLVGEMELYYGGDGYYVKYYLDRGKGRSLDEGEQPEKIADRKVLISYIDSNGDNHDLKEGGRLILTFDRENGGFREIQSERISTEEMQNFLDKDNDSYQDLQFKDSGVYCSSIIVTSGLRTRIIRLNTATGTYSIQAA